MHVHKYASMVTAAVTAYLWIEQRTGDLTDFTEHLKRGRYLPFVDLLLFITVPDLKRQVCSRSCAHNRIEDGFILSRAHITPPC